MSEISKPLANKLAAILEAQEGWDSDSSQPVNRQALANYLRWLADAPSDRAADLEPMLTDEGLIRLEWERAGVDHTVEIGPELLWMNVLSDQPEDDACVEFKFSVNALDRFFRFGELWRVRHEPARAYAPWSLERMTDGEWKLIGAYSKEAPAVADRDRLARWRL